MKKKVPFLPKSQAEHFFPKADGISALWVPAVVGTPSSMCFRTAQTMSDSASFASLTSCRIGGWIMFPGFWEVNPLLAATFFPASTFLLASQFPFTPSPALVLHFPQHSALLPPRFWPALLQASPFSVPASHHPFGLHFCQPLFLQSWLPVPILATHLFFGLHPTLSLTPLFWPLSHFWPPTRFSASTCSSLCSFSPGLPAPSAPPYRQPLFPLFPLSFALSSHPLCSLLIISRSLSFS